MRGTERPRHAGAHGGDGQDHPPLFFPETARAGFRLEVMAARESAAPTVGEPAATVAAFQAELDPARHPPARRTPGSADTRLGGTVVHAEDIRRPFGIIHAHAPTPVCQHPSVTAPLCVPAPVD